MRGARALERSKEARSGARARPSSPTRTLAVGDPQASAEKFFAILAHHGLLGEDGWLAPDVRLVSLGDHFDFGSFGTRFEAGLAGTLILSWLAAHTPEQVTLIAGNHDLARVAELNTLDDVTFQAAAERAYELYRATALDPELERAFLRDYPMFPSVEVAARDLCTFQVEQRNLVSRLLRERRFRLAAHFHDVLFVHAGATIETLANVGLPVHSNDAERVALRLNEALDAAVDSFTGDARFAIAGLFTPGSAERGEPGGFLFHRPAHPSTPVPEKDRARRFDPRTLPRGLCQVVGHVRDAKCRQLLGDWVRDEAASEGRLRHLAVAGDTVSYRYGVPENLSLAAGSTDAAAMIFVDGGMQYVAAEAYELFDVGSFRARA